MIMMKYISFELTNNMDHQVYTHFVLLVMEKPISLRLLQG